MPIFYGAAQADVAAMLPHLTISATSHPSTVQVDAFLDQASQWVAMRLGDISSFSDAEQSLIEEHARWVVVTRAAGLTQNAAFPEQSGDASRLGPTLMKQADDALNEALEAMGEGVGGVSGTGQPGPPRWASGNFPMVTFPDRLGF
jgi:hypothetical protein